MFDFLKKWGFDPKTAFYTILIVPIFLAVKKVLVKHIKDWTGYLWEGIMYLLSKYVKQSLAASLSMKRYCRLQLSNESLKYLHIPSSLDINLDIDKIFVNLTLSYLEEQENSFSHKDFLTIGNRIKIMGDPGAGKSSLIKKVFREYCRQGLTKPGKTKLPYLVELKNINPSLKKNADLGKWLFDHVKKEIAENKIYKMDECFETFSSTTGVLILLDGLDEVSSSNYALVSKCINEFSNHLNKLNGNNTIVLTMRTQFYQQVKKDFNVNFPHSAFLKPFTPSDVFDFLSRWYFEKDAQRNISRIYKDLTDRPTLREMCSNPLILSMYVAEDQISKGNVSPESRTQFYKKVTEELIIKRRLMQKSSISVSYSALKEQRENILGKIAYYHLVNIDEPRNNLKWEDAIKIIKNTLKCDASKAESVFYEISRETGLITEERYRESFRFIHLTFCEFLAAFEVVQGVEDGWSKLLSYHKKFASTSIEGKSRLIEVIPFTAGLLPRIQKDQALLDISNLNDMTLMSRCFLETKFYTHESWNNFIKTSKANLLNKTGRNFDEKWLQDLHIFNVVVNDANLAAENLNYENIDLTDFYGNLLDSDKTSLNKILTAFASQDAAAVFRLSEICRINLLQDFPNVVINNCDQTPFLGLITDKIIRDEFDSENWAALLAESSLLKKLVSDILDSKPKDDIISMRIKKENGYRIWYYKSYIKETFLTQCISLSTKNRLDSIVVKNLNLLLQTKSPSENRYKLMFYSYITMFLIIGIILILLNRVTSIIELNSRWGFSEFMVSFSAFYVAMFYTFIRYLALLNFYKISLNLRGYNRYKTKKSGYNFSVPNLSFRLMGKKNKIILTTLLDARGDID